MKEKCKPVYEFILWNNCRNRCRFCWQRETGDKSAFLDDQGRIASVSAVKSFLRSDSFVRGSHVLLVGGEIFDGSDYSQESRDRFVSLFRFVSQRMLIGAVDIFYLNTNLLYPDLDLLFRCLDLAGEDGNLPRVRFTTSYDREGRFNSRGQRDLFLKNLETVCKTYPGMPVVANAILTRPMAEAILSGEEDFRRITDAGAGINAIPYIILDKRLAADFSLIRSALEKLDSIYPGYLEKYIRNLALKQDKLVYEYRKGSGLVFCSSDPAECGHSENFRMCLDDGSCIICRLEKLLEEK